MDKAEADRIIAALAVAKLPAVGLKWRPRKDGRVIPYWYADDAIARAGYPVKSANLDHLRDPLLLSQRCARLQDEMLEWRRKGERTSLLPTFDFTFGALIEVYISDRESPFNDPAQVDANTQRIYLTYARKLKQHIGTLRIDESDGRDVKRWFDVWADRETPGDPNSPFRHLPKGRMVLTVMKAAVSFGIVSQRPGSIALPILKGFQSILYELAFPARPPRTQAPTAAQVEAIRKAAHDAGRPRRALAYALQFETQARQWDIIGKFFALSDPRSSAILWNGRKWIGPMWPDIDADLILSIVPGKTRNTTGARVTFDLAACPMVMEEIARVPASERHGPLIISEGTGRPYSAAGFEDAWHADFAAAQIPKDVWNRDLRAGGNTEASRGGANKDDRAKLSGHSPRMNARVYDRDAVEAHRRVMEARLSDRAKNSR